MIRRPTRSKRHDTLSPYTPLFRSARAISGVADIHARPLAHGVEAPEHLDGIGAIGFAGAGDVARAGVPAVGLLTWVLCHHLIRRSIKPMVRPSPDWSGLNGRRGSSRRAPGKTGRPRRDQTGRPASREKR